MLLQAREALQHEGQFQRQVHEGQHGGAENQTGNVLRFATRTLREQVVVDGDEPAHEEEGDEAERHEGPVLQVGQHPSGPVEEALAADPDETPFARGQHDEADGGGRG